MKHLLFIICIAAVSCCSTKTKTANEIVDKPIELPIPAVENSAACIIKLIEGFEKEEKQNPPRKIYSYTYRGKTVYYVTPPCCDFFSDLYNSDCVLMGHPDGGITGRGDGKFPDFEKTKSNEKLVWEDKRK